MSENRSISDLPAETLINIFNRLRGKELINITRVCKNWNFIIGNTQMDKISIRINDKSRRGLKEAKELFEITDREYKHITMYFVSKINLESFETYGFNWKSVKLLRSTIESFDLLKEFLLKFVTTIEELDLMHLTLPSRFDKIIIKLPKLKVLRCEHLRLEADVLEMLKCNIGNLKEFLVSYRSFSNEHYHIMLNATQIQILRVSGIPNTNESTDNLHLYLKLKQDNLQELQLDAMDIPTLKLVWNELSCYKTITFGCSNLLINNSNFTLDQNTAVTKIYILHFMQYSLLDKIIHASPNLKCIIAPRWQDNIIKLIAHKLTILQELYSFKIINGHNRRVIKFKVNGSSIELNIPN